MHKKCQLEYSKKKNRTQCHLRAHYCQNNPSQRRKKIFPTQQQARGLLSDFSPSTFFCYFWIKDSGELAHHAPRHLDDTGFSLFPLDATLKSPHHVVLAPAAQLALQLLDHHHELTNGRVAVAPQLLVHA
jgi:hypothetical protein